MNIYIYVKHYITPIKYSYVMCLLKSIVAGFINQLS